MTAFNEDSRLAAQALEEQPHTYGLDCGADAPGCRCENKTLATAIDSGRLVVIERDLVERLVSNLEWATNYVRWLGTEDRRVPFAKWQDEEKEVHVALTAAKAAGFGGKPTEVPKGFNITIDMPKASPEAAYAAGFRDGRNGR